MTGPGSIILCPLCDTACKYQRLHESCLFSRITYLFDNPATVFFAIFMSFWGKPHHLDYSIYLFVFIFI